MKVRKGMLIAAVLSFGLFTLDESALAQEEDLVAQSHDFNCHNGAQVYPSDLTGQICLATHGGGKGDKRP
jgi:hypothetical protein